MADSIKGKMEQAGHKIAETATKVGHKIGETAEQVTDWAKEKLHQAGNRVSEATQKSKDKASESCGTARSTADIHEHMDVFGSCGNKLGRVDHVEGNSIKLTKNDSPDGEHHYIPLSWVSKVDNHVHLSKDCSDARNEWQSAPLGTTA
jgi:hypothetical protein